MPDEISNPAYTAFFAALVDGRLRLGQTLTQDDLCRALGYTLSPVREATTLLEAEKLITVRRKVGITIFYPDVDFIGDCFQFRGLLEREGLRKFAATLPEGWIARMRVAHEEIIGFVREVNDLERYRVPVRDLESQFHRSFIGAYGNAQISSTYARLSQKMYLIRLHNLVAVGPANTVQSMNEHLLVVEALAGGDVEGAMEALDNHLMAVLHRVITT